MKRWLENTDVAHQKFMNIRGMIETGNLALLVVLLGFRFFGTTPQPSGLTAGSENSGPGLTVASKNPGPGQQTASAGHGGRSLLPKSRSKAGNSTVTVVPDGWAEVKCSMFYGQRTLLDGDGNLNLGALNSRIELPPNQLSALKSGLAALAHATREREARRATVRETEDGEEMVFSGDPEIPDIARDILGAHLRDQFSAEEIEGYCRLILADHFYCLSIHGCRFSLEQEGEKFYLEVNSPPSGPWGINSRRQTTSIHLSPGEDIADHGLIRRFQHLWRK